MRPFLQKKYTCRSLCYKTTAGASPNASPQPQFLITQLPLPQFLIIPALSHVFALHFCIYYFSYQLNMILNYTGTFRQCQRKRKLIRVAHSCCLRNEIKHAARVLSRYRDARRTRILRIRLRLTIRVNHGQSLTHASRVTILSAFLRS